MGMAEELGVEKIDQLLERNYALNSAFSRRDIAHQIIILLFFGFTESMSL